MILISLNGESQLVESLDGYDGWVVVEDGVDPPPNDHCTRVGGAWVEDADAKAAAERIAAINAMSPADLVDMLQSQIDTLTTTVDQVAATVAPTVSTVSVRRAG